MDSKLEEFLKEHQRLFYLAVFLLAVTARTYYAVGGGHSVAFNAMDASEYLRNARLLAPYLSLDPALAQESLKALFNSLSPDALSDLENHYHHLKEVITRSGPVYPFYLLLSMQLTGTVSEGSDLLPVVLIQGLLNALSCLLMYFIASRIWDRKAGLATAFLAALYPGSIINSARLISEPLAFFFVSTSIALATAIVAPDKTSPKQGSWKIYLQGFLAGVLLALNQLTRSALALVSIVFLAIGLLSFKGSTSVSRGAFFAGAAGFTSVLAGFAALQKLVTGKGSLMVDRLSRYNLYVGVDLDARGWLAYPFSNFAPAFKNSHLEMILSAMNRSPLQFIELMASKIARLFAVPWNDFKSPLFGLGPEFLVAFHKLILLFAIIGFSFSFLVYHKKSSQKLLLTSLILLILIAHGAYIFFESQPRYAYTALPSILLLAGAGLSYLTRAFLLQPKKQLLHFAIALTLSITFLTVDTCFFIGIFMLLPGISSLYLALALVLFIKTTVAILFFLSLYMVSKLLVPEAKHVQVKLTIVGFALTLISVFPLQAYGRLGEWHTLFDEKRTSIKQQLTNRPPRDLRRKENFVLVDLESWMLAGKDAEVEVDSFPLKQNFPLIPLMSVMQNLSEPGNSKLSNGKEQLFYELGYVPDSMLMAAGGKNLDIRQWFLIPLSRNDLPDRLHSTSKDIPKVVKLTNRSALNKKLYGSYTVKKEQVILPGLNRYSWDKAFYGIESATGLSDLRYTEKYNLKNLLSTKEDLSEAPGLQTGNYNLRMISVPLSGSLVTMNQSRASEYKFALSVKGNKSGLFRANICVDKLPSIPDRELGIATVNMTIESHHRGILHVPVEIIALFTTNEGNQYISPWVPSYLTLTKGVNHLHFSIPFKVSGKTKAGANHFQFSSLKLTLIPGGRAAGNQHFSTSRMNRSIKGNPRNFKELKPLLGRDVRIENFEIDFSHIAIKTPLSGYEIF